MNQKNQYWSCFTFHVHDYFGQDPFQGDTSDFSFLSLCQQTFQQAWIDLENSGVISGVELLAKWNVITISFFFFDKNPETPPADEVDAACRTLIQQLLHIRGDFIEGQEPQLIWGRYFVVCGQWGKIQLM